MGMSMFRLNSGFIVDTETGVVYCCGVAVEYQSHFYYYPTCPRYKSDGSLFVLSPAEMRKEIEETNKTNKGNVGRPISI